MKPHVWKQVIHTNKSNGKTTVIGWECVNCKVGVGRHFPEWSEDSPQKEWLEVTGIGENCI